jgi:Fur family ferric uptake transcriptional regulator
MPLTSGNDQPASHSQHLRIVEPLCAVFRRKLKSEGLKYTPERAHVLDTIVRLDELFEAETIIERVKHSGIRVSKATVYRTIKLLQEAGIIQRVLCDEDQARYQLAYGAGPQELIVRLDTREIITISSGELAAACAKICAQRGLTMDGYRLHIFATAGGAVPDTQ